jgi:hypothetical protein
MNPGVIFIWINPLERRTILLEKIPGDRKNSLPPAVQFVKLGGETDAFQALLLSPAEYPQAFCHAPGSIGLRLEEERDPGGEFFAQPFDRPEA